MLGPVGLTCALLAAASVFAQSTGEWPAYGGDPGGTRFSALDEINRQNVANLKPVWNFRTGDLDRSDKFREKAAFESTPIMVDGTLYLTTPTCQVFALDPVTGEKRWSFDPQVDVNTNFSEFTDRGTPMTYRAPHGKQYVVICAGGHGKAGTKQGDYVVAYALP